MTLADVNVLVSAHREDSPHHAVCHAWLLATLKSDQAFGVSETVLASVIRVVTHPRIFKQPSRLEIALAFVKGVVAQPHAVLVAPGPRHWDIFAKLCRDADARGNIVADAYLAALAIESGSDWVTMDGDFSRFPGLKLRNLLRRSRADQEE